MKPFCFLTRWLYAAVLVASSGGWHARGDINDYFVANKPIPDGDLNGTSDTHTISGAGAIGAITVTLNIEGRVGSGFNGDLYITLSHGSGFSVLLNRTGRVDDNTWSLGYGDNGFNVVFNDQAANGDIHNYRSTLSGNNSIPLTGQLTGIWAPDARASDPTTVKASDSRTAFLDSFKGLSANGSWTLTVIDTDSGGTSQLVAWGMDILSPSEAAAAGMACTIVPESARIGWIASFLALGLLLSRPASKRLNRLAGTT